MPVAPTHAREAFEEKLAEIRRAPDSTTAWTLLYRLIAPQIRAHLFRLGTRDASRREDLLQDVFVRFIKYSGWSNDWALLPPYPEFVAYVRTVTRNAHRDAYHRASHMPESVDVVFDNQPSTSGASATEMQIAFRRWLSELSKPEQELLRLLLETESLSEISERLHITYSAAATRISRLRQRLREM
jgi:RNA polymerase sigma factor (sigma-70 family)